MRKRRPPRPTRSCVKKTGPEEVELDRDRRDDQREQGAVSSSSAATDDVHRALHEPRGAREHRRVDAEDRDALDVVDLDRGAEDVEQRAVGRSP